MIEIEIWGNLEYKDRKDHHDGAKLADEYDPDLALPHSSEPLGFEDPVGTPRRLRGNDEHARSARSQRTLRIVEEILLAFVGTRLDLDQSVFRPLGIHQSGLYEPYACALGPEDHDNAVSARGHRRAVRFDHRGRRERREEITRDARCQLH
jgi:hypothetical protein